SGRPSVSRNSESEESGYTKAVARLRREIQAKPAYDSMEKIVALCEACLLSDVRKAVLEVSLRFVSFEDLWRPFLGGSTGEAAFARKLNDEAGGGLEKQLREMIEAEYGGDGLG